MYVHRRKAALVVMRVPERKLLAAMRRAERVINVEDRQPAGLHRDAELVKQSRSEPRRLGLPISNAQTRGRCDCQRAKWRPTTALCKILAAGATVQTARHRLAAAFLVRPLTEADRTPVGSPIARSGDGREPRGPVDRLATVKPHAVTVAPDDHPVAVVLDLVHPIGAGRRRLTFHRLGGHDEPDRQLVPQRHNAWVGRAQATARQRPPQLTEAVHLCPWSSCSSPRQKVDPSARAVFPKELLASFGLPAPTGRLRDRHAGPRGRLGTITTSGADMAPCSKKFNRNVNLITCPGLKARLQFKTLIGLALRYNK
jgi:hypothetical protein